ncbi:E3 ubiquitin-protein ligase CCNB1IP1 [Metarhizium anisopliae]|nr:E3 ubiquitin-protein ligase CCNB1IP1 [Metarhizium anisopliae]
MDYNLLCNNLKCRRELRDRALVTTCSEDYKAIVLSGLSPGIVLECAERALNFWAYQKTQEICYQQHVYGILTEKHSKLKSQLHQTVTEANAEIARLQTIIDNQAQPKNTSDCAAETKS